MLPVRHAIALIIGLNLFPLVAAAEVDYERDIKPLLAEKCGACHGALKQEAGLRLDHGELLRRGGDSGSVLNFEQVGDSLLLTRILSSDLDSRMPPEGEGEALNKEQAALLKQWIAAGASSPDNEIVPPSPEEHWAWQLPTKYSIPVVGDAAWAENPIDAFVYHKLQERGLTPGPMASKQILLRRAYFDLIGLPPTLEEQQRFLEDDSPTAWENLTQRLIENPAHGQRWARHWMDVWRYSDWYGYKQQLRGSQRHMWRWRDWIVESLNADKGYDQMIVEMLAGDEIAPEDDATLRATGFLARNYHNSNRNIWLDATVEHTAKAFLGITINCARCHDHKYDPLSQREYYSFRAIFEPHNVRTERVAGEADIVKDGIVRAFDAQPDEPTYLFIAGNEKHPDKENPVQPAVPSVLGRELEITPVELPAVAAFPALRDSVQREDLMRAKQKVLKAFQDLEAAQENETKSSAVPNQAAPVAQAKLHLAEQMVIVANAELVSHQLRWRADELRFQDREATAKSASETEIALVGQAAARAEHVAKLEVVRLAVVQKQLALTEAQLAAHVSAKKQPIADSVEAGSDPASSAAVAKAQEELSVAEKALAELAAAAPKLDEYTPVGESYPRVSTGRRLALARWIASPENPLTARVAVNYVWLHYFGQPLVDNVFDFGLRSPEPLHRDLLDWLSVELMENQWSLKHLQGLILNSRTYRLASSLQDRQQLAVNLELDSDNQLLWRANIRRLEAEVIRDSVLHVAGNLDQTLGGPDIDFEAGETNPRRSLYFRHAIEKQMTMMVLFDAAAPTECYRRSPTIVPQQALALANSPLSFDQSRALAGKLANSLPTGDDAQFIRIAFQTLLNRDCSAVELETCLEFLIDQAAMLSGSELTPSIGKAVGQSKPAEVPEQRARENLIHILMNHNDFVIVR